MKKYYILTSTFYLLVFLLLPQLSFAIEARLQIPIPGFQPSETLAKPNPETGIITTDLLPEYIAAIYSYLVGLAGLFATSLIMYGGMKWIFAGGDSGKISKAKEVIQHALVGLVIALGSYLILFTLNPKLTTFEALRIRNVSRELLPEIDEGDPAEPGDPRPTDVVEPNWTHLTFNCNNPPAAAGVIPEAETERIPKTPGIILGNDRVHRDLIEPIRLLGKTAEEFSEREGVKYEIVISSGYRPFDKQVQLWCGPSTCFSQYDTTVERKSFCAVPGFSNHGYGIAVDVGLMRNGALVTNFGSKSQCTLPVDDIAKLAEIFYAADERWLRYEKEIWHFEYNPTNTANRLRTLDYPAKCR